MKPSSSGGGGRGGGGGHYVMLVTAAVHLTVLGSTAGSTTTTVAPSTQCKYNFVLPPPDIVGICSEFNVQEKSLLQQQIVALQQQVASLSQGRAANVTSSSQPHFVCDCQANASFQFAFQDCNDVGTTAGRVSGVYQVTPVISTGHLIVMQNLSTASSDGQASAYWLTNTSQPIKVYCDLQDDLLSWIVLMKRRKMDVSFDRTWSEYQEGFGNMEAGGDFWLGLERMHQLTSLQRTKYMLWIVLTDEDSIPHVVRFSGFRISSGTTGYSFSFESASSSKNVHLKSGRVFVSKDYDPYDFDVTTPYKGYDRGKWKDCVTKGTETKGGGWWFEDTNSRYDSSSNCGDSNLNAPKPYWKYTTVKAVEMKIRPEED